MLRHDANKIIIKFIYLKLLSPDRSLKEQADNPFLYFVFPVIHKWFYKNRSLGKEVEVDIYDIYYEYFYQ